MIQNKIKIIALSSIIASTQLFGTVNPTPPVPSNTQAIQQKTQITPEENQNEYTFKKGFRNIHEKTAFGYYFLMFFYAVTNGTISEAVKAKLNMKVPSAALPFTREALDFIEHEIEDKHKDNFEYFCENFVPVIGHLGVNFIGGIFTTIIQGLLNKGNISIENPSEDTAELKELVTKITLNSKIATLNKFDSNLDDFQKGINPALRSVIKTLVRAGIPAITNKAGVGFHAGCAFEPVYPLLFDGIVTQLPEDIKNSESKKRLIRATRGLIRAAVRTAIY